MNTSHTFPASVRFGHGASKGSASSWQQFVELLAVWAQRARTRRELAALDERLLQDIGLRRGDALHEASKPFWRP